MKNFWSLLFLCFSIAVFSQESIFKKFQSSSENIEIYTQGLDNVLIETSKTNFIEVVLFDENPNQHYIITKQENGVLKISFSLDFINIDDKVFRKFITKRLNRASVIVKIPAQKNITVLGENIDVQSKNYEGNLAIFIEKGNLQLYTLQGSLEAKLFAGNIYATIFNSTIQVITNNGKITVDDESKSSPFYFKENEWSKKFTVESINANVTLTTL